MNRLILFFAHTAKTFVLLVRRQQQFGNTSIIPISIAMAPSSTLVCTDMLYNKQYSTQYHKKSITSYASYKTLKIHSLCFEVSKNFGRH